MSTYSKIEWTDTTWNPLRGCQKISPGCKHCYAETFAERFRGVRGHPYEQGFDLRLVPEKLLEPFRWTSRRIVFVNSMSDLFQDGVSTDYIRAVAQVMVATPWHTYQVLTKRSGRMKLLLQGELAFASRAFNVWWGVSVEDRKHGVPRIQDLKESPAYLRFLSVEPLLEDLGEINLERIDWVIVGGESGPGARNMQPSWVQSLLDNCEARDVRFFFKQWGGVQKKKAGRLLNNRTYDDRPLPVYHEMPSRAERASMFDRMRQIVDPFLALTHEQIQTANNEKRPTPTTIPRLA